MDELIPEIAVPMVDTTQPNENGTTSKEADSDVVPFISSNDDSEVPFLNNDAEEVSSEDQNGEVVAISPGSSDEVISVPHNEQNGDVVEIDGDDEDDKGNNGAVEPQTDVIEATNIDDDLPLPLLNCEATLEESNPTSECIEINNGDEHEKPQADVDVEMPVLECQTEIVKDADSEVITINNDEEYSKKKKSRRHLLPCQVPQDYTPEELEMYKSMFCTGNQSIQFLRLHCTACNVHLGSAPNKQYKRFIHPLLKVLICKECYEFYGSGEFDKDEDGSELYCRWCGQGGKVLCCAKCPFVFCQRCIKCNLGKAKLQEVLDSEDWLCFECVPSQTIRLRVNVRALYDFVQSEMNLAAELNQPERLKIDNSMCCIYKVQQKAATKLRIKLPMGKRKNSELDDGNDVYPKKKKIKLKTLSSLLTAVKDSNPLLNQNNTIVNSPTITPAEWVAQDEDEVVCTPDLSLLMPMEEEEGLSGISTDVPVNTLPNPVMPKLHIINPTNKKPPKQLGYKLPKNPIAVNTSNSRPLLAKALNKVPKTQPIMGLKLPGTMLQSHILTNKVPSKIIPGTKYEWFEKASQFTGRVNLNLTSRLASLGKEQSVVSSIEGLASIHNNFQEILNNSIKSLTQIRKNLRNDFIAGLKTLRYDCSGNLAPSKRPNEDNDVIVVDPPVKKTIHQTTPISLGRLKLKPPSVLLNDNVVITIPDDVFNELSPPEKPQEEAPPPIEVEKVPSPVEPEPSDPIDEVNIETRVLIRRAMLESKFETIVNENMKYYTSTNLASDLLKRMVSVRVVVEEKFGPATPRMHPRKGYIPMNISKLDEDDIENMLSSSIVLNISKRNSFVGNSYGVLEQPMLGVSDEIEHLSNGIL